MVPLTTCLPRPLTQLLVVRYAMPLYKMLECFLAVYTAIVLPAWRHMQVVFVVMGLPRPASSVSTVESAASDKTN